MRASSAQIRGTVSLPGAVNTIEVFTHSQAAALYYGVASCPVGPVFLSWTERGICALAFGSRRQLGAWRAGLQRDWSPARLVYDPQSALATATRIFRAPETDADEARAQPGFRLLVRGTDFQLQVWRAALKIPAGSVRSYQQLADLAGRPRAARATAAALAANSIAYLVPCHRVLRATGALGGYRWGAPRKRALLAWEAQSAAAG